MNYHDLSKEELITEIGELKKKYDALIGLNRNDIPICAVDELSPFKVNPEHKVSEQTDALKQEINLRIQTEHALSESEKKYRNIVDYSTSIVLEWDTQGNVVFLNKYGFEFFGFAPEEIIGRNVLGTIVDPLDSAGNDLGAKMKIVQQHPEDFYSSENENIKKNGDRAWIAWTNKGIYDPDGRLIKTLSVGIDRSQQREMEKTLLNHSERLKEMVELRTAELTALNQQLAQEIAERKQVTAKIRESEANYRNIYDNALEGMYRSSLEGNVLQCNESMAKMLGFKNPDEVVDSITDAGHQLWVNPDKRIELTKKIEKEGVIWGYRCQYRRKDGRIIWVSNSSKLVRNENGDKLYYEGFIEDITESVHAEEKLKENNSRLELAMKSANMAWWDMDITTGRVTFDNRKPEMLGFPPEKFKHYNDFMALVHPEDSEKILDAMRNHIHGASAKYEVEYRIQTASGEYKWLYDTGTVVKRDKKGIPLNVTGLVIDITERKNAEEELKHAKEKSEESEKHLRLVADNLVNGIIYQLVISNDNQRKFTYISDSVTKFYGCTVEEAKSDANLIYSRVHKVDRERLLKEEMVALEKMSVFKTELRLFDPEGNPRWAYLVSSPRLHNGQIYWDGIEIDITERKLTEEKVRISEEKFRAAFMTIKDGFYIGTLEEGIIIEINSGFQDIFQYTANEIIGKTSAELGLWAIPEDRALMISQLNQNGYCDNLETIGRRKSGELFNVSITAAIIFFNQLTYIVGVIRDVTEKKVAEEALKKKEDEYRTLVQNLSAGIVVHDSSSAIILSNRSANQMLGLTWEQLSGKKAVDPAWHFQKEDGTVMPVEEYPVNLVLSTGNIIENYLAGVCRPDMEKPVWVICNGYPVLDDDGNIKQAVITFADITKRKEAEELLRLSEDKFRNVFEYAAVGISMTTIDGKLKTNNAFCQILGYSEEELSNLKWQEITNPEDVEYNQKIIDSILSSEVSSARWEKRYLHKKGGIVWADICSSLLRDEEGKPLFLITTIIDITDRKLAEIKLGKLNRLYAVISQVNQAIVHLKEKDKLFEEVCRIAIESGKFRMAWIGLIDHNKQIIKPKAYAGFEEGYLSIIRQISVSDAPEGRGPTGSAIREGKHFVCSDFDNDPNVVIWKHEALKRGYRSSIALPIKFSGTVIGAFTLYASIPDFFDQEEIELLTGVANDIGFALDNMGMEKNHQIALAALVASENQFHRIFDNLQDAYFHADKTGQIILVSPSAAKIYGYNSIEEMNDLNVSYLYANPEIRKNLLYELSVNDSVEDFISQGKRKDGSTFWVSMNVQIQYDENGQFSGTVGVVRDISERMQSEEKIVQIKKRFQTMFEQAPLGITLINSLNDEILEINEKFSQIIGRSKEEIKALGWMNITHPDDLQMDIENRARMNAGEISGYEMRKRFIRTDGSAVCVNMTIACINSEDKGCPQNLCMIEDITERINNEDKIRILSSAVEQSPVSIVITDINGNIEYVNPKFSQITGYSSNEAISQNPRILKSDKKTSADYKQLWETITSGREWHGEFLNVKKNGETYYESASISPIFDETNQIAHFIAIKEDITARKKDEENIRTLSTALEQSPSMIVITDKTGKIEYINAGFSAFTQYSPEEIIGKDPRIFKPKHHTEESFRTMWETLREGKVWQSEFRNRKKDGTGFWENVTISPITGPNELTSNYIIIKEDISEKKQLIHELIEAKEKAEESDRLKSAFLTNMSHEIRTPMNGILGFAGLLEDPALTGDEQREYISIIEKSGARMLNIINEIVDISRIESGLIELNIQESNINEQTEFVYDLLKLDAEEKGIGLTFKNAFPTLQASINTDREKLYAILTNLVKNAIKYTDKGSVEFGYSVETVHAPSLHAPSLHAPSLHAPSLHAPSLHAPSLQFYVKDTGIGIPVDRQKAIFERFIQADIFDVEARQGAGLGLSIAKAYVEMLGGQIWVESEYGIGSTFYFTLPFETKLKGDNSTNNTGSTGSEAITNNSENSYLKILIVEDDEASDRFLTKVISKFSTNILHAQTGIEAVEICRNNADLDLVLMDIRMPGMNGYEATQQIRQFNKELIIIAQTAFGMVSDREKSLEAGCNDYISKPINKNDLLTLIHLHITK